MCERPTFDARDAEILAERIKAWDQRPGPRVGDFVRKVDGSLHRFTHHWGDGLQITWSENARKGADTYHCGSFYLGHGYVEFSGGLDPAIPVDKLVRTDEVRLGRFWFFHHNWTRAHNGVHCDAPCRVWQVVP